MTREQEERLVKSLDRIANSLEKLEGHLRPAEGLTRGGGRPYKMTIAEGLDRLGDLMLSDE